MKAFIVFIICILLTFQHVAVASDFRFSPRSNKADLIQWRPWGKAALDEAMKRDKPILLSLSAVWCHWCHVMDETTYSDLSVIAFINENFIPVRVDEDRRPDVDSLYNQGGWPSTVVLTAEGAVISGGTYIPPDGMLPWLAQSSALHAQQKGKSETAIGKKEVEEPIKEKGGSPDRNDITRIMQMIQASHDDEYGGFGSGQKFPNPDAVDFLLAEYVRDRDDIVKKIITTTLDHMASGEIFDAVAGGFFRYATRPDWSEPHYEKMLDSNAGIIRNYATANRILGDSTYRKIMLSTMNYLMTYLYDRKSGAFFGSQDADETYYRKKERRGLKPPFVDRTIYADSNAQMIMALLAVSDATGSREYLRMARKTADFITSALYTPKEGIYHYHLEGKKFANGMLSDNVLFGLALIDLYNATGERSYIRLADDLAHHVINRFYDKTRRAFVLSHGTTLVTPSTAGRLSDALETTANYRAIIFLSRLHSYRKDDAFKGVIDDALAGCKNSYGRFSPSGALYGTALRWNLSAPVEVTVIAGRSRISRFLERLHVLYIPEKVVKTYSPKRDSVLIKEMGYPFEEAMYLCAGKKCSPPIHLSDNIPDAVKQFLGQHDRPDRTE